ncbi:YjgN family protein [Chitiniphilus purpureus]|uniref:YjgN family protein n=1 Tax=Chitiniphilus purpureus TaxID=2981137 RepID=A0ABY6DM71_9NEIS|nr:YjgN family protein [Chitiniphilus sp. CD1]UXY14196.1 YjgN family protein [Chitiniphilus sp. CD1]
MHSHAGLANHAPTPNRWPLRFHGRGGEYFRIWIVNLVLSVLTLGIYSAWAKVRRLKYFYGSTELAGSTFDYTAQPMAILKGRLLMIALLAPLYLLSMVHPVAPLVLAATVWLAMPWIVVRSLSFNLRHTRYRNVAFGFNGRIGDAYLYFLALPLLLIPTLGLAWPFVQHQQRRFITDNVRFGTQQFAMRPAVGAYYMVYLISLLSSIGLVVILGLLVGLAGLAFGLSGIDYASFQKSPSQYGFAMAGLAAMYLLMIGSLAVLGQCTRMMILNTAWNHTEVADCRFESKISLPGYAWALIKHMPLFVLTLGLAAPWVTIALARYRIEHMAVLAPDDLSGFEADRQQAASATGSEAGDLLDVDLAL